LWEFIPVISTLAKVAPVVGYLRENLAFPNKQQILNCKIVLGKLCVVVIDDENLLLINSRVKCFF
jgi:hypothetical protein